jgi:hypothetical protein
MIGLLKSNGGLEARRFDTTSTRVPGQGLSSRYPGLKATSWPSSSSWPSSPFSPSSLS